MEAPEQQQTIVAVATDHTVATDVTTQGAVFTLVMLGDEYTGPALALGASLVRGGEITRRQRRCCMVTRDVSPRARLALSVYWEVYEVPYLSTSPGFLPPLLSFRMQEIYGGWIRHSFTKWRCLELAARLSVRRFVYMDADTVVLSDQLDRLFALDDPEANGQEAGRNSRVLTGMFPVFSSVSYHRHRYHEGAVLRQLRAFETTDADERAESATDSAAWCCDVSMASLRDTYRDAWRPVLQHKRHFLLNSSLVSVTVPSVDRALALYASVHAVVVGAAPSPAIESARARSVSLFANGWDEQVFAEALLAHDFPLEVGHLRTTCNVNAGFWDSSNVKRQPWTMTWWGSGKPWNDFRQTPKYTDVYLYRYFAEAAARDAIAAKPRVQGGESDIKNAVRAAR